MPIMTPGHLAEDYRDADHFEHVLDYLFVPALQQAGYTVTRPSARGSDVIHVEIIRNLETASLVLCDISTLNANVMFELGIRTALDLPACIVRDDRTSLPFDVAIVNCFSYSASLDAWRLQEEINRLATHVIETRSRSGHPNPMWKNLGLTQRGEEALATTPKSDEESLLHVLLQEVRRISAVIPPVEALTTRSKLDSEVHKSLGGEGRNVRTVRIELEPRGAEVTVHALDELLGESYRRLEELAERQHILIEVWAGSSNWAADGRRSIE
jgi:hypothetical protein